MLHIQSLPKQTRKPTRLTQPRLERLKFQLKHFGRERTPLFGFAEAGQSAFPPS